MFNSFWGVGMNVSNLLLLGFGKMGHLTFKHLRKTQKVDHFHIVEPNVERWITDENVTFYKDIADIPAAPKMDCAFIITPAVTHFDMMSRVISLGVKNIFVEKPAVCTTEELQAVQALGHDCKIVVGYILRQSDTMCDLSRLFNDMQKEGYSLKNVDVLYVKDANECGRFRTDIGVLDEAFHVWDILFNCLNLKEADKISSGPNEFKQDTVYPDKYVRAKMKYSLSFGGKQTDISMISSFESPMKKRNFIFRFVHEQKPAKSIVLSFDKANRFDQISVLDNAGHILYTKKSFALKKLKKQIDSIFEYFVSGQKGVLHELQDSFVLQQIYHLTNNAIGKNLCCEGLALFPTTGKEQNGIVNMGKHAAGSTIKNSRGKIAKQNWG